MRRASTKYQQRTAVVEVVRCGGGWWAAAVKGSGEVRNCAKPFGGKSGQREGPNGADKKQQTLNHGSTDTQQTVNKRKIRYIHTRWCCPDAIIIIRAREKGKKREPKEKQFG
jgi:hypothetical protein